MKIFTLCLLSPEPSRSILNTSYFPQETTSHYFVKFSKMIRVVLRVNLHFTLWMCIADDSSKVKGVNY